jgi:putative aminopeptidase
MTRRAWLLAVLAALSHAPVAASTPAEIGATLHRLVAAAGVSGYEGPVRAVIRASLPSWAAVEEDNLGNLTVTLGSGSPRRLLVAHMDEPGYVVTAITEAGYLKLQRLARAPLPALFDQFHLGQPVLIGGRGGMVPGVTVVYSTHLWRGEGPPIQKPVSDEDLFVDVGARSAGEARAAGVAVLDPVTIARRTVDLAGGRIAGPALDDRAGCAVLISLLRSIEPVKVRGTLTVAFSAQELVDARGAARLAARLEPDESIIVDSPGAPVEAPGARAPGASPASGPAREILAPGGGPVVGVPTGGISADLHRRALERAARIGVTVQNVVYADLGDGAAFGRGVRVLPLGVPVLHPGAPAQVASAGDVEATARLLKAMVEEE